LTQEVRKTIEDVDGRLDDLIKAIYGHPALGQRGFQEEVQKGISTCQTEVKKTQDSLQALLQEHREEEAGRRERDATIKRFMSFTGLSSILTFLTLLGLIITILSGSGIVGG
jgi:hypothetical protein